MSLAKANLRKTPINTWQKVLFDPETLKTVTQWPGNCRGNVAVDLKTIGNSLIYPQFPTQQLASGQVIELSGVDGCKLSMMATVACVFTEEQWDALIKAYGPCAARQKEFPTSPPSHGCLLKVIASL
jgi:hypothetical protein